MMMSDSNVLENIILSVRFQSSLDMASFLNQQAMPMHLDDVHIVSGACFVHLLRVFCFNF